VKLKTGRTLDVEPMTEPLPAPSYSKRVTGRRVSAGEHTTEIGQGTQAYQHTTYQRPLGSKQGISSPTNQPTHTTSVTEATEIITRADATITFATSINANQPVATLFDRVRVYDGVGQYGEIEGRAMPVSSYLLAYLRYLIHPYHIETPGFDKALANTTQTWAAYRLLGLVGKRTGVRIQDVIKVQPYTGSGAVSAYSENDGSSGEYDDVETALGKFYVARSFASGISSLMIKKARAFMLAAANDIDSGFTIKAGDNTYVAEEINDIEDRINDLLGTTSYSINGAAAASYRSARGQPEDPFTGAAVFLFADLFSDPEDVQITLNTTQAIQVAAISDEGIGAMITG